MINVKRVKDEPKEEDGYRILVDRIWPVGMSKEKAKLDLWLKDIGPSTKLRKWFSNNVEKWEEYKDKYFDEVKDKDELINTIINKSKEGTVTLLFGSKEHIYNNATALKEYIESKMEESTEEIEIESRAEESTEEKESTEEIASKMEESTEEKESTEEIASKVEEITEEIASKVEESTEESQPPA